MAFTKRKGTKMTADIFEECWEGLMEVMACPDGPLLVRRNPQESLDEFGNGRRVIAICRCQKSQLFPLCDGTHKHINARDRRLRGEESAEATGDEQSPNC